MSTPSNPVDLFFAQIKRLDEANGNAAPPEQIARYAQELIRAGITLGQLTFAVDDLVLSCKWFPKLAEIMDVIGTQAMRDSSADDVRKWIVTTRRKLAYELEDRYNALPVAERGMKPALPRAPHPDEFPDRVTEATVRRIGWDRLRDFDFEDPFRMAEFQKAYEQAYKLVDRDIRAGRVPWSSGQLSSGLPNGKPKALKPS